MAKGKASVIVLSSDERRELESLTRRRATGQSTSKLCLIFLPRIQPILPLALSKSRAEPSGAGAGGQLEHGNGHAQQGPSGTCRTGQRCPASSSDILLTDLTRPGWPCQSFDNAYKDLTD
jgi:hypothetical protein